MYKRLCTIITIIFVLLLTQMSRCGIYLKKWRVVLRCRLGTVSHYFKVWVVLIVENSTVTKITSKLDNFSCSFIKFVSKCKVG
jgi:hypothetical protein